MLATISAAIAPGIALLSYFYLKDKYQAEPIMMVSRSFVFGALLVFPIMVIQYAVQQEFEIGIFGQAFVISSMMEEFFKWFIVYYTAYQHVEFDEHYDGIIYGAAVSLGFASMENFIYLWINGLDSALLRALLPVSGHALFAVAMGYYMGKAKFTTSRKKRRRLLLQSIMAPIMLHGIYNWILLSGGSKWLWFMIPFMFLLWIISLRRVAKASISPPVCKQ
ncbi:MAG: intramembrane metalloprotease PrsW [Bacillaceae bacterium]|nr:intramembrane metalloprotease PrsW [Bacillaceae bacterium]